MTQSNEPRFMRFGGTTIDLPTVSSASATRSDARKPPIGSSNVPIPDQSPLVTANAPRDTAGLTQRGILKCIHAIHEHNLDLEACKKLGGSWETAATWVEEARVSAQRKAELEQLLADAPLLDAEKLGLKDLPVALSGSLSSIVKIYDGDHPAFPTIGPGNPGS